MLGNGGLIENRKKIFSLQKKKTIVWGLFMAGVKHSLKRKTMEHVISHCSGSIPEDNGWFDK